MRSKAFPVLFITAVAAACVVQKPVIRNLDLSQPKQHEVGSPVKAHLYDGSTILYPSGITRDGNSIGGTGQRFFIGSATPVQVVRVSLDSIVGMEAFTGDLNAPASVVLTTLAVGAGVFGAALAAVAIFGSCPTIYADSAGTELLQAESFSYAIAPLFEQRDVDRLRLTTTSDGRVVLRIRNEMLETHYINHLELIEASHGTSEEIVPDPVGRAINVSQSRINSSVTDRAGRDLAQTLQASDGNLFSTADTRFASITANDLEDHIDIAFTAPESEDSVAVVINFRNSLLNTVLLYDHILGAPGLKSLDYVSKDLEKISTAVDVGRWYAANMGMRVSVLDGTSYRRIARIGDSGPIAFHRMAFVVPAVRASDGRTHVRLSFAADNWRIDEIGVASKWKRAETRTIPVSRVTVSSPAQTDATLKSLRQPDESYVITTPGQAFTAEFDVGKGDDSRRTWFLASQGYYSEWVRGDWIKNASGKQFEATNETLFEAIRSWRAKQKTMESQFYSQRIAAR